MNSYYSCARVFVSGFVQGVNFRQFVKRSAIEIGLNGWVRNLPDGRVEALFVGRKEKIEQVISLLRKGNFLSEVRNVDVVWQKDSLEQFEDFKIIRF